MSRLLISTLFALAMPALVGCGSSKKAEAPAPAKTLPATLEEAVTSSYRAPENTARDQYRHPLETLSFFGLTPEMTVVEISPGGGWYLEILAPFVASRGHYVGAVFPANAPMPFMHELNAKIAAWVKQHPELEGKVTFNEFSPPSDLTTPGSADMVLTFRNVHNWMTSGSEKAAFQAFFKALKPGGVLGVVEHRADPKSKFDPKAPSGYVREKDVIRMAESAGFKLDAKSEINANPKDTRNHPQGVWTLPPTLRLKDQDREKYLAIGESDRMTLRFVKPLSAK